MSDQRSSKWSSKWLLPNLAYESIPPIEFMVTLNS